jgi:hypothetical protein
MRRPSRIVIIWLFFLFLPTILLSQSLTPGYANLSRKPDAGYYLASGRILKFWFEEEYSVAEGTSLTYKILDSTNKVVANPSSLTVKQGYNQFDLNVTALSPAYYLLEVSNAKNEKWYLRFKVE